MSWKQVALLGSLIGLCGLVNANILAARDWPWKKKAPPLPADTIMSRCSIDPDQIQPGSTTPLHAKVEASDSRGHPLGYVWDANAGKIIGLGPEVELDATGVSPGSYSMDVQIQDAYQHRSSCTVSFRVIAPPDSLTMSCRGLQASVLQGKEASFEAEATDRLDHPLHYLWFTNGGKLQGEGPQVRLDTAGLTPGDYTITGRVEDDFGMASDCSATVKVEAPPPPPVPVPPPQPVNIAEIQFARNRDTLDGKARSLLQKVLNRLAAESTGHVSVEAYAGPDEGRPHELAASRADAVRRYLLENGVDAARVHTLVGIGGRRGGLRNQVLDIIWLPDGLEY